MGRQALDIEARGGSIDLDALGGNVFPFDAFSMNSDTSVLTLNSPWTLAATPYAPVAGEPSLGTPHTLSRAVTTWDLLAKTEVLAAPYVWDVGALGVPVGATRLELLLLGYLASASEIYESAVYAWNYDAGADSFKNEHINGFELRTPYKPATAAPRAAQASWRGYIPIGASRKVYIARLDTNTSAYALAIGYDS